MPHSLHIAPLPADQFDDFIVYLNDHLADNGGSETGYFQPLPRDQSCWPAERAAAFRNALATPVGAAGWRRAWVVRSADGRIAGHIDLRAPPERFAAHRCLLGMGVDRGCRRAGLGAALIGHARAWAKQAAHLDWIDLQVISDNRAAIALYQRAGFVTTGQTPDMFRIDGRSFAYSSMSLAL